MTEPLSPLAARRVFLTLTTTRWLPIGFVVGLLVLWQLERGLTLPQALTASAVMGIEVVALELPTSGFADDLGRRPVLIAAALANVAAMVALLVAHSFTAFAIASVLTGVFRAAAGIFGLGGDILTRSAVDAPLGQVHPDRDIGRHRRHEDAQPPGRQEVTLEPAERSVHSRPEGDDAGDRRQELQQ